jgi:hypothetical protein
MPAFVKYTVGNRDVLIEVDAEVASPAGEARPAAIKDAVGAVTRTASKSFEEALSVVTSVADTFAAQVDKIGRKPAEVELSFALEVAGEAAVFSVAKASGKGTFNVKIKW